MRRWVTIFLFLLLPLQSAWVAAGSYCQHETGIDAQHFGHHEHRHHGNASDDGKVKNSKIAFTIDGDCGFCHPCCCAVLSEITTMLKILAASAPSTLGMSHFLLITPSPPDRPNWQPLV